MCPALIRLLRTTQAILPTARPRVILLVHIVRAELITTATAITTAHWAAASKKYSTIQTATIPHLRQAAMTADRRGPIPHHHPPIHPAAAAQVVAAAAAVVAVAE